MPLPDKNDPIRPLMLAIRSMRLLGILSIGIGLVVVVAFGYLNTLIRFRPYFIGGGVLICFLPGILYLVCAMHLTRRSRTAVIFGLLTTGFQLLCAMAAFAASITLQPVSPIPIVLAVLWNVALIQVIWYLWRSLEAIQLDSGFRRGFDLGSDSPKPVLPIASNAMTPADDQAAG